MNYEEQDKTTDFTKIEEILKTVKSRIETHNEFKNEYDKQLAFDFSLFNFFGIGENKISQILAYFLDDKQNHGQGNIFLEVFVRKFYAKEIDIKNSINICEKTISDNRRIDIYIEFKEIIIAIENKVWADDQDNQLKDYATYLEKKSNGNYLLLYLNPYGSDPLPKSIPDELKNTLIEHDKLKIISYKNDIIDLINQWLVLCEAENVSHFLKEFKKFLEIKFLGKNTLNMSKDLRTIIYNNEQEVEQLVNTYKDIEVEVIGKLNAVGKKLDELVPLVHSGIVVAKNGPFNWYGTRVYKFSIAKEQNKIWVQFVKNGIHLYSNYYFQDGTDEKLHEILAELKMNNNIVVNHKLRDSELIKIFLDQVKIANDCLNKSSDKNIL